MENHDLLKITSMIPGEWFFVGGVVRDSLLGHKTHDIDIVTTSTPEEIEKSMSSFVVSIIGKRFGTIGVFFKKWKVEITTTRSDINPDGRHTDVKFIHSFHEDCKRRDFSINALLMNFNSVFDYVGGLDDLESMYLRFIGNPQERIDEDYLRILRYIRFSFRFKLSIDKKYESLFKNSLRYLSSISMERILSEIKLMCSYDNHCHAMLYIQLLGMFKTISGVEINLDNYDVTEGVWIYQQVILFWYFDIRLPLTKSFYRLRNMCKSWKFKDPILQASYIWHTTKSQENVQFFARLYQLKINTIDIKKINTIDLMIYHPTDRSLITYLCIYKQMIDSDDSISTLYSNIFYKPLIPYIHQ